jgi:hypothetical protein
MNDREHRNGRSENLPPEIVAETAISDTSIADAAKFDRIIPRLLRNILVLSIVLLAPAFWFYRLMGAVGFAFGAAVSYVNFLSLSRGVEALTARIVDQHSQEKGGLIVARFLVRYVLVGVVAYAIFKGSSLAFYGLLWGLCAPVAALMVEAVWQAYMAFRRVP